MSRRVYFHIDELSRDSVVAANLRLAFRERGVDMVYGNRRVSRFLQHCCPFDLVIFPKPTFLADFFKRCHRSAKPTTVFLPTETIGFVGEDIPTFKFHHFGTDMRVFEDSLKHIDAFLFWGQKQIDMMKSCVPQCVERCHVVGHPRYDRRCIESNKPLFHTDDRIKVGFSTRFDLLNTFDSRNNFIRVREMVREGWKWGTNADLHLNSEDFFFTNAMDVRSFIQIIERLDTKKQVAVIRVHPRENRHRWVELIKYFKLPTELAPWDQPYLHWVRNMDFVIAPPSTTFYDCYAAGRQGICISHLHSRRHTHVPANWDDRNEMQAFVPKPTSYDELLDIISVKPPEGLLEMSDGVRSLMAEHVNYPDCRYSLDRIADVCIKIMESRSAPKYSAAEKLRFRLIEAFDISRFGQEEQSATFSLTPRRRAWINALARPELN